MLNIYLSEMSEIAIKYGGTIDKYIGDAIMIFFGDPESQGVKNDAIACVQMGLAMQKKLVCLRKSWSEEGIPEDLNIRIGINTGYCTVGNYGSEYHMDYTIIGGEVNLASRLESHAQPGHILISRDTYLLVRDHFICEKSDEITVKGIAHPVQTYIVVEEKTPEDITQEDRP